VHGAQLPKGINNDTEDDVEEDGDYHRPEGELVD